MEVESYIPMARRQAQRAAYLWHLDFDEVYSDALFGLANAVARCKDNQPLERYATVYVRGSILHGIRNRSANRPGGRHGMPKSVGAPVVYEPKWRFDSFDRPTPSTGKFDLVETTAGPEPSALATIETQELWDTVAKVLRPREFLIVGLHYRWGLSQEHLAKLIGVSQMQISRLLKQSLERLRQALQ